MTVATFLFIEGMYYPKKSVIRILKVMYMSVNVRTKKAEVDVDSPPDFVTEK